MDARGPCIQSVLVEYTNSTVLDAYTTLIQHRIKQLEEEKRELKDRMHEVEQERAAERLGALCLRAAAVAAAAGAR